MNNELFEYEINDNTVTILKYIGSQPNVVIPPEIDGYPVTTIGTDSFKGCSHVQTVQISNTVTVIEKFAFTGCSLTSIVIPDSVTKIGTLAFNRSLGSIILPNHPVDTGDNFKDATQVLCRCGQMFMINPDSNSNKMAVCPRCGLTDYAVTESAVKFGVELFVFIIIIVSSIIYNFKLCFAFILFLSPVLIFEWNKLRKYLAFKERINPELANQSQAYSYYQLPNQRPAATSSQSFDSSSAAEDNTVVKSEERNAALPSLQERLDKQPNIVKLPPLPDYFHQNPSLGCIVIPCIIILGLTAIITILAAIAHPSPASLFLIFFAVIISILSWIITRWEYPTLKMSVSWMGIQCNRMTPNTIPWESVISIDFNDNPNSGFIDAALTKMTLNLELKGDQSQMLYLRFYSAHDAAQCRLIIQEFHRRSQLKPFQPQTPTTSNADNSSEFVQGSTRFQPQAPTEISDDENQSAMKQPVNSLLVIKIGIILMLLVLFGIYYVSDYQSWEKRQKPEIIQSIYSTYEKSKNEALSEFEYESFDKTGITITKFKGDGSTVNIPAAIKEKPVIGIGLNAFSRCSSVTSVIIPESVKEIGDGAFAECSSLTSLDIPENVEKIECWTFRNCSSLTSVSIPKNVNAIGDGAFSECSSLTSITIPENVTEIGEHAFFGCRSLTSVTIPENVSKIGDGAFTGCSSLTSVVIKSKGTEIDSLAFYNCPNLTIQAPKGSIAERFAKNKEIPFEELKLE